MSKPKPDGPYADRLLGSDGWPEADEDKLYGASADCTRALQNLTFQSANPWAQQRSDTFQGGTWSGGAANSANATAGICSDHYREQQAHLVAASTWNRHVAGMVAQAKETITEHVHEAQRLIQKIESDSDDPDARKTAIDNVISVYHALIVTAIAATAAQVPTVESWKPPPSALEQLLSQKLGPPPPATQEATVPADAPAAWSPSTRGNALPPGDRLAATGGPTSPQPPDKPSELTAHDRAARRSGGLAAGDSPAVAVPPSSPGESSTPQPPATRSSTLPVADQPAPPLPAGPNPAPATSTPARIPPVNANTGIAGPNGGTSAPSLGGGTPGTPAGSGGSPTSPLSSTSGTGSPSGPTTPQTGQGAQGPQGTQAPKPDSLSGATGPKPTGMQAPVQPPSAPLGNATPATPFSPPAAPIEQTATSSPTAPAATHPTVPSGNVAPPSAPSSAPASPTPPMPLGAPATPPPAAPVPPTSGPPVIPAATSSAQGGGAAAAPIPVSAARAERDLVAASAAAGALKRKTGGSDPLSVARRIAAALNAPDMSRPNDIGFFWLVALTADDTIIVANSYGIAYIPDGVKLPEQVKMVSADTAIPAAERARWATYPVAALTAWAQAHETTLRAVIGTTTHLEGIDPGAHKILLEDDDIPPSGKMTGRDRLQIGFPDAATKLAAVKDPDLIAQLPPAQADSAPPANETFTLWFDVMQPLMSAAAGREIAHLNAFALYAAHSADLALYRAHNAAETADQRAAITDWLYWLHQYDLLTEAQADVTAKT